jgi:hypothetical protein
MTDIEKKARALLNECGQSGAYIKRTWNPRYEALCRAIERHEAFRQEVSDAVRVLDEFITGSEDYKRGSRTDGVHLADGRSVKFARFIIAKPDPLEEALRDAACDLSTDDFAEALRAAIAKHGGKIVWENSDA